MKPIEESRKRSVDNLQRVFTVVISLSMTEALRQVVNDATPSILSLSLSEVCAFVSLIFTIIPFYHGANRYMDETYILGGRKTKSQALMLDFVAIFIEGLIFFILALQIQNEKFFYTLLAALLLYDAIWVGLTRLTSLPENSKQPPYFQWAFVNLIIAALLLVSHWSNLLNWDFWQSAVVTSVASVLLAIVRTVYDYGSVWDFYLPQGSDGLLMPVPRPARPDFKKQKNSK